MDDIQISNRATYWPVAPIDVLVAAPIVSRLVLGATLPGRLVQAAAFGAYLASAAQDWYARQGVRKIDFRLTFGADVHHLTPMPHAAREAEVKHLVSRLNNEYTPERIPRRVLAVEVDQQLTRYIAGITGQRVKTSAAVRSFSIAHLVFPFALGACDVISGDVAIFRDMGIFEPHIIAHEFSHRKGYWKELEAQVLAYFALVTSGNPVLVQSALAERLHRQLVVLAKDDNDEVRRLAAEVGLRPEIASQFLTLRPAAHSAPAVREVEAAMRAVYDARMRLTGQNGLSDYDRGFTDLLYAYETTHAAA